MTDASDQTRPHFASFDEFWPFYVGAHRDPRCRVVHYTGGLCAIGFLLVAIVTQGWWWLAGVPLAGYGFAWFGHFCFERNTPATFDYPLYSLVAEFKMLALGLAGRMGGEVRRYYGESAAGR